MIYIDIGGNSRFINKKVDSIISVDYAFYERLTRDKHIKAGLLKRRFNSTDDYFNAYSYLDELSSKLSAVMKEAWQELYGIQLSCLQAEYLFKSFMSLYIFMVYDHFLAVNKIVQRYDSFFLIGIRPAFYDGHDQESYNSYRFHTKIYTYIFEKMGYGIIEYEKRNNDRFNKIKNVICYPRLYPIYYKKTIRWIKRMVSQRFGGKLAEQKKNDAKQEINNPQKLLLRSRIPSWVEEDIKKEANDKIAIISHDDIIEMFSSLNYINSADASIRHKIKFDSVKANNDFEEILFALLPKIIPPALIENFGVLYKKAIEITKDWSPKYIYTSEAGGSIGCTMLLASLMERNSEIYNIQHSGMHGYHEGFSIGERRILYNFLSWGWNSEFDYGIVYPKFMSRRPCKQRVRRVKDKNRWLFITNAADALFECGWGVDYSRFCDCHFEFVNALSKEKRKKIVVRIEMYDETNPIKYRYATKYMYKEIRLEERNALSFENAVMKSELVICDIVSSSHLEVLSLGVPVVFFDGCIPVIKNREIEQQLENLKKQSVFFDSPHKMGEYLNELDDIETWWNELDRQRAIKQYLSVAANDATGEKELWKKEILSENNINGVI